MTGTVRIADTDIVFEASAGRSVLDAAYDAGWQLPYSCRKGACNTCEGEVVSGHLVDAGGEALPGPCALLCQARADGDVVIRPRHWQRIDPGARKTVQARVYRVQQASDDVYVVDLRFPPGVRARFVAGQYLEVVLEDGRRRSFSMANPPQASDGVQLHVRRLPGGHFSEQVLPGLKAGDRLTVELPFGDFHLREAASRPAVLIAASTGFAPMKSLLEDVFKRRVVRPIHLYWGARRPADLYLSALAVSWAEKHAHFRFTPVVSEARADDGWQGRSGLVHHAVMEDHPTLQEHDVYACGSPSMVEACRRDLVAQRGLDIANFYSDSFVAGG